jgi:hypothetical protein
LKSQAHRDSCFANADYINALPQEIEVTVSNSEFGLSEADGVSSGHPSVDSGESMFENLKRGRFESIAVHH